MSDWLGRLKLRFDRRVDLLLSSSNGRRSRIRIVGDFQFCDCKGIGVNRLMIMLIVFGCLSSLGCDQTVDLSSPSLTGHSMVSNRNPSGSVSTAERSVQEHAPGKILQQRKFGTDWSTFLGPTADGKSTETGIIKNWRGGNLKVIWRKTLGEGYGMGTVSAGRYFHFDRHEGMARVRSFNAESGEELWVSEYKSDYSDLYGYDKGPRTSPVVDGNRVYVFGVEGMMHCLAADTGEEIWKRDTSEQFGVIQNFFGVASTPVIYGDLLIAMVGGSPPESKLVPAGALDRVKPNGTAIVAYDKLTGEVKYQFGDDLASYSTIKLATINGRDVGFAWMRAALICFEPQTGKVVAEFQWRSRKLESVNASTPIVEGDHVLISECYEIGSAYLKLAEDQFDVIWDDKGRRDQRMASHWNTPIVIDGMLYGCSGRQPANATLRCVELATGKVRWSKEGLERCSLTSIDGHFVVLDEAGRLLLIEANSTQYLQVTEYDGEPEEIKFKRPCWAAPIVSHGLMYVRGKDELVCFELIKQPK